MWWLTFTVKKCKNAFWPIFALAVISAAYASSWLPTPGQFGGGSEGRVSACVLSVAPHAGIHAIRDPRAWKKSSMRKGSWRQLFLLKYLERVGHTESAPLLRGSFFFSVFLPVRKLFWLSDFLLCFLYLHQKKTNIFTPFGTVHNSSYFNQFSNSRFLKETKYCRIKFNTIRTSSRKKKFTSLPPNWKAHINKKYISTSCFPYICLIAKNATL